MTLRVLKYVLFFVLLLAAQLVLVPLLSIYDVYPDVLLIGVMLVAIRHGAVAAIITGFLVGLAQDGVGSHIYGLQALSKAVAGFIAGKMAAGKPKFDMQSVLGLVLTAAFAQNLIHDGVYYFDAGYGFVNLLMRYVLLNSVYTAAIAMIFHIVWPSGLAVKRRE